MPYSIMTSSAKVSGKARLGTYRNIAVIEWDGLTYPKMISKRARGMLRIIHHFGSQSVGITERCQYKKTLLDAGRMIESLNDSP
ncbi:MAG: hypothetical protein NTZ20_05240 [Candidatus Levybacteria bacterium]|nr:hypothetical protein [Candidatus Levybacteria bacterium]